MKCGDILRVRGASASMKAHNDRTTVPRQSAVSIDIGATVDLPGSEVNRHQQSTGAEM